MPVIDHLPRTQIHQSFGRHVSSGKEAFFQEGGIDLILGRREGPYVWDLSGRRLVDFHCNGGVFNLGHRHPRVLAALRAALDEVDIGNHHLVSEARARLGERLAGSCPGDLNRVVFAVSGGEAIDMAIKLARAHTRRSKVISAQGGYHGHTGFALAAGDAQYREPFAPVAPGFTQIPFGDLQALEESIDRDTAAVLFETVPATLGIVVPPDDFFPGVRRLCDTNGVMMIADEVQTGLGRCGLPWAISSYNVVPDILVAGKGLSGGLYPIAATIYRDALNDFLHDNPFIHISTFGGAEVGCHVALEVLDILEEPDFLEHVNRLTGIFHEGLAELARRHSLLLREVRQKGLMIGLKMADAACGPLTSLAGLQHGILTVYANHDPSVSQFLPPLILTAKEAHDSLQVLDGMLTWVAERTAIPAA